MNRRTIVFALCLIGGCQRASEQPDPLDSLELIATSQSRAASSTTTPTRLRLIEVFGKSRRRSEAAVRVVLSFEGAPVFERELLPKSDVLPARLAIHLPGVEFSPELPRVLPVGGGGLTRVRLGEPEPRVVFDLAGAAEQRVFYFTDPHRIVVDVSKGKARSAARSRPVVVLDPGHGGRETGTAHRGLVESRLALDLAKRTAKRLRKHAPRSRVVLTRDTDMAVSLAERSAIANALSADVFVSIHLNGSPEPIRKGGVTTFVLDVTNDRQAIQLAARENGTQAGEVSGIQEILAKLHRKGQLKGSRSLAASIQQQTLASGRRVLSSLADRGVRNAMFYVLVGATMPAVLVEASFLTRDDEAEALRSVAYRDALSDGMARGIARYLERL